jgi:hypothetical protein
VSEQATTLSTSAQQTIVPGIHTLWSLSLHRHSQHFREPAKRAPSKSWLEPFDAAWARLRVVRLARIGRQRLLVASVAAVAALRGEERPLEGELLGEGGPPFV